ncbi:MAG TPA: hypothetical protein VK789_02250 [Bryobacteraceae bacterium]|jgi:hypothetical protein|nr:hypothetical protein [Bryobacteraceae bacterium]
MKRLRFTIAFALICASAPAQWLHYPSKGVPRTPDGKPDLSAPAPRAPDGHPDLTGIWDIEHNRKCPPEGCNDMEIGQEFMNIGWSLKGGLPYQPWAEQLTKQRTAGNGQSDPSSHCVPVGPVKLLTSPLLRKIVQTPGLLLMLSEFDGSRRQIFTDGRPLPEEMQPAFNGYSTGAWEGDVLVVHSAGFRDGMWLDRNGSPMTDAAKVTERYHRVNFGKMEIDLTVDDPKAYTKPWTVRLNQFIVPDTDLMDYYCAENEKDIRHYR